MKAIWLLVALSFKLNSALTYCPEKCLCLRYTDRKLTINCSGSEQKEVPYGLDPQVKVLDLSCNEIKSYNHSKYLKAVENIDLSNNKITKVYFGGSFKYLTDIDLSYNYIDDLQKVGIRNLEQLRKLNLSHNLKLQKISGLESESLEHLILNNCLITYIYEDFLENVPNIRRLDIVSNYFPSLTNIRSESLEILDASQGKLQNLTQNEIFNLPNVNKLNISFNPDLKINFSYENSCWDVKDLDISNSELSSLDDMFPFCSLEYLNASTNKIQIIEVTTFFNNCELVSVNLSKNKISDIANRAFFTSDKLKILDLSVNNIQDVDFTLYLTQLTNLDLSRNLISNTTNLVLKNVIDLNLSHNKITDVYINFNENTPKIKKINLSNNKIKNLQKMASRTLTQIDLSHCKIISIDTKAFEGATNLIQLNLVGNKLTSLDFRIFKTLDNLKDLMLTKNQWACQCGSQEFKEFYEFLTEDRSLTNLQDLKCAKNGDTWKNTCMDTWHREKEWKKTVYSLTVSLAIALIVVAVIFFCKYFNDKKQLRESEREARERRENIERRLNSYQNASPILSVREPIEPPQRSSTPPPNYEAALLLPKLTEEQRNLAISTLSIATPTEPNDRPVEEEETREPNQIRNST